MNILDNVIIISLIVAAFAAGMKISDRYHKEASQREEHALRLYNARQMSGDYASYVAPIGEEFMDRLKKTGRAIQQLSPKEK